jgi:hypothetical protein
MAVPSGGKPLVFADLLFAFYEAISVQLGQIASTPASLWASDTILNSDVWP